MWIKSGDRMINTDTVHEISIWGSDECEERALMCDDCCLFKGDKDEVKGAMNMIKSALRMPLEVLDLG